RAQAVAMISRSDPWHGDRRHEAILALRRRIRRSRPIRVLLAPILLSEPGVEALDEILAMVAPEFDVADQIGLHMVWRGGQFRQDVLGYEGRRIRQHGTIGNI